MMPKKMAEVKFTGKIKQAGDILDGKALVGQQQARLIEPGTLDVLMDGALARCVEQGTQTGIADFGNRSEFKRLPVARRIGRNGIENAHYRRRQLSVWRGEDFAGHKQFAQQMGDGEMHLPLPPGRFATDKAQKFILRTRGESKVIQGKLRVFVITDFLVPELKPGPPKPNSHNGKVPVGQRNVSAGRIHVHQPDLAAAPKPETARLVFKFAFAGLYPKQVCA